MSEKERDTSRTTLAMVKSARKGRWTRRLALGLGFGLALTAIVSAVALAQVLTLVNVNNQVNAYSGVQVTDSNFPASPSLAPSSDATASSCATVSDSPYALPGLTASFQTVNGAVGVNGSCTTGAFSEEFSWNVGKTGGGYAAETVDIFISTTYGSPSTTVTIELTMAISSVDGGSGALNIYVDYGSVPNGIASLTAVLT